MRTGFKGGSPPPRGHGGPMLMPPANRYSVPMPSDFSVPHNVLTLVDPAKLKLLHLMALVLHERGEPLTYEDIQSRLREIGVDRPVSSLQKAWHGMPLLR